MYTTTKSGSMYMRKKFDKDAANPNSGSIWTTRMLFMVGGYFLFGLHAGAFSILAIVSLYIGMAMPWMPLFVHTMIDFVLLLFLMSNRFVWRDPIYQELDDDHSCAV
jgi:hypothetical protein